MTATRAVLALAGASVLLAPVATAATAAPGDLLPGVGDGAPAARAAALDAAAAWNDSLEAVRAPRLEAARTALLRELRGRFLAPGPDETP